MGRLDDDDFDDVNQSIVQIFPLPEYILYQNYLSLFQTGKHPTAQLAISQSVCKLTDWKSNKSFPLREVCTRH